MTNPSHARALVELGFKVGVKKEAWHDMKEGAAKGKKPTAGPVMVPLKLPQDRF